MGRLIILGTGNASIKNCYNTCFALEYNNEYLFVDAGGEGKWYFKTIWHVLDVIWIFRMIAAMIKNGEYDDDLNIYCHDELVSMIETIIRLTVRQSKR